MSAGAGGGRRRRRDLEEDEVERLRAAIRAGDTEAALAHVDGVLAEAVPIHDLNGDLVSSLLTFIAGRLGEDAVEDAWRYAADDVWRPALEAFRATGDTEGLARAFAGFLISHRYGFEVWEDDEGWTFEVQRCTSGERMQVEGKVARNGGDPGGHHRFGATQRPHPWSLDRADLPYYDVHSALWMKLLPAEWGWDVLDVEYATKAHGSHSLARYRVRRRPPPGP